MGESRCTCTRLLISDISDLPHRPFLLDLTVLLGDENVRADKTQRLHVGFVCL